MLNNYTLSPVFNIRGIKTLDINTTFTAYNLKNPINYGEDYISAPNVSIKVQDIIVYGFIGKDGLPLDEDGVWGENTAYAVQSIGKNAFEFNPLTLTGYPGIWSHSSIRSGKVDISPQPSIYQMIKSL